ncbi:unnamed protein product [Cylindrotheca closterium]|uniref:Uncharacterized protein n=1 Tax=Cylindrotheca closterium TaxID=2856 RepID=A0AAD2PXG3_9STRA|nr:unnamed protein product [Cylindrotheca closterium]
MAPNLNHRTSSLHTLDLDLLVQPIKATFPPLTLEVAQQTPMTIESSQQDSSSYWEWSSENDAEINKLVDEEYLSADHIVSNILLSQPAVKASSLSAANDQYWGWSHARTDSVDYWNWNSTSDEQRRRSRVVQVRPASVQETDSYWAW